MTRDSDRQSWRPIPSLPGYWASSDGRIRGPKGDMVGTVDRYGYRYVNISKGRRRKVHRLVCEAFHGPPTAEHCAHLDGDTSNDAAANLAWKTPKENNADKRSHGTHQSCAKHPRAKLSREQVQAIRSSQLSSRAAATEFGVSQSQIVRIRNGDRWAEGIAKTGGYHD